MGTNPAGEGPAGQSSPAATSQVLQIHDLAKTYHSSQGTVEALKPVNLTIRRGEFVSFVGPSGCGKTTLLNMMAALLEPTAGQILFNGEPLTEPNRDIGIMFQSPVLLPWRSVEKNALLPAEVFGIDPETVRPRVKEVLELVGLQDFAKALPQHLSGGMQQRAALARVLVYEPQVLLMDEPFGALDEFTREAMNLELLRITEGSNITSLFVTHNITEAVFLADRVVVMSPRPGRVAGIIDMPFERPRRIEMMHRPEFSDLVFEVRDLLGGDINR